MEALKGMDLKKSALCQHVTNCDHFIAWDDTKILKMEPNYSKRLSAISLISELVK